jgi:hypothetical protein
MVFEKAGRKQVRDCVFVTKPDGQKFVKDIREVLSPVPL